MTLCYCKTLTACSHSQSLNLSLSGHRRFSWMDSFCELTQFRNLVRQVHRNATTSLSCVIFCREKRKAEFEMYLRRMMKRFSKEVREDTHKVFVTENNGKEEVEYKAV